MRAEKGGKSISAEQIFPNPDQPRRTFCPKKLEELAQSIKENELLEPIVVTERQEKYMIVAGERRFRACGIAGIKKIPVKIIEADDKTVAELALLKNIQREDLNPVEEARAYQNLLDKGSSIEELAQKMGFKQTWRIRERLDLLRLAPVYQRYLVEKLITPSQAYELSRLPHNKQDLLYQKIRDGKADTYNKLRSLTNALLVPPPQQTEIGAVLTEEEKTVSKKYDRMVETLCRFIKRSFNSEDMSILEKVLKSSVSVNIEKIDMIVKYLNQIKKAMVRAESAQEVTGS